MPVVISTVFFVSTGYFNSQLNDLHTELLLDIEFTKGNCTDNFDTSLKI